MTPAAKKQKLASVPMSDYVPPQPLVNALRNACTKIQEQQQQLSEARKKMERLQTLFAGDDPMSRKRRYETSIDCAIKAWRSATATYAELLQSLGAVTAVQSSASQMEHRRLTEFNELERTANEARSISHKFILYEELEEANGDRASSPGLSDLDNMEREAEKNSEDPAKRPSELYEEVAARAKANASVEKESKPVFERGYISNEAENVPHSAAASHIVPRVEYEDVSAEVEARLKAREAKKAAAKKEKKRKRESGESVTGVEMNSSTADKRAKKKAKPESGDEEAAQVAKSEKRNKHARQDEDALGDRTRKKRKKTDE